jgi:3-hydroxybutyryl-CoA dehydratase
MSQRELLLDEIEVGHTFSPLSYSISDSLIRKYVDTVEDDDPLHRDPSYAQQMGYEGTIAPPTIAALYVLKAYRTDEPPPLGGVHLRQRFRFYRPVYAGDILHVQARIVDRYMKKGRTYLVIESLACNQDGEDVIWSESTSFWTG